MRRPTLLSSTLLLVTIYPSTAGAGFRTDRLSPRHLQCWRAIERVVLAEDARGEARHPVLRALYQSVAESGHVVHVELIDGGEFVSILAGQFLVERVDPAGLSHVGVLRLNLRTIDRASPAPPGTEAGLVRFAGLGRVERHAEVLGHELAHAAWSLATPDRARHARSLQQELEELGRRLRSATAETLPGILARLTERDARAEALEVPAYAVEARVLAELAGRTATPRVLVAAADPGPGGDTRVPLGGPVETGTPPVTRSAAPRSAR